MSIWRLEWLRLWRTRRLLVLVVSFVLFGLAGPVVAYYLPSILESAAQQDGFEVIAPPSVPADGFAQYVSNASQIGLLVVAVIAAMALATDSNSGTALFYRTRVRSAWRRILPRYVATLVAVGFAFTLGLLSAWYETEVLLGPVEFGDVLGGLVAWKVYLAFAVAVVALAAAIVKSVPAVVGVSVATLLLIGALGLLPTVGDWLPGHLVSAPDALVRGADFSEFIGAMVVTLAAAAACLWAAVALANRREL